MCEWNEWLGFYMWLKCYYQMSHTHTHTHTELQLKQPPAVIDR